MPKRRTGRTTARAAPEYCRPVVYVIGLAVAIVVLSVLSVLSRRAQQRRIEAEVDRLAPVADVPPGTCAACHAPLPQGARYCPACGEYVAVREEVRRRVTLVDNANESLKFVLFLGAGLLLWGVWTILR